MKALYTTSVHATGGRNGSVKSEDGIIDFEVRMPKKLGGEGGEYTNPEQLFAAGYAACFDSALNLIISKSKIETGTTEVTATVGIGPNNEGGFQLEVKLSVKVPGVPKEEAEKLIYKAHEVCPYSNATRGNIDVQLEVVEGK